MTFCHNHSKPNLLVEGGHSSPGGWTSLWAISPPPQLLMLLVFSCSQLPKGMDVLMAQLGTGGQSAAALAFLANCIKDHGAVAAAIELFRKVSQGSMSPEGYHCRILFVLPWPSCSVQFYMRCPVFSGRGYGAKQQQLQSELHPRP